MIHGHRFRRLQRRQRRGQAGAALIVSLIMLLLLTIVGVSSMRNTAMQERMAGNLRARAIAFERAEKGLRAAEAIAASDGDSVAYSNGNTNGRYNGRWQEDSNLSSPRWSDLESNLWTNDGTDVDGDGEADYGFILEQLGQVPRDENCQFDGSATSVPGCYLMMYLITAQAEVPNTGATVVLQTTYKAPE